MKLWHKVFLCTFVLFELLFNAASFYLIEHNFNQNLKMEVGRGLSEQQVVLSQIETDWAYVSKQVKMTGSARDFLKSNAGRYVRYFDGSHVFLEIQDDQGQTVYNDFTDKIGVPRGELDGLKPGMRNYIIRDVGAGTYLFVGGSLSLDGVPFKMSYIRNITDVYKDRSSQVSLFFKMNIAITLVLASGLYALIWFLTRPVRLLNKTARTIADGDYTQRVQVSAKDEIGVLAESFNQMAEAVESKVAELECTAKNKQSFIEYLTHELKTPLTAIIGYADYLRTAKYSEEVFFKALNYIYSEGKRLESLSFKLMDLILAGNEKPEIVSENVAPLCADAAAAVKPSLEKCGIRLLTEVAPSQILADKDLFKLLCTNLLDNAVKASKPGGRIFLRGFVLEDGYALEIEDEGIGIPVKDIEKIFEPFFVVDKARAKAHHGAGLGLAICAEIVRLHGGTIAVTSVLDEGTQVRITFPGINN